MLLELLDAEKMLTFVSPLAKQLLAKIEIFPSIDSTNTYLLQHIKLHVPSGSFCFAEEQTAGRGRLGRSWYSPYATNLYFSLVWHFQYANSGLSIAIAVAVLRALRKYGLPDKIQLKWPNDIWFAGRKLAGILLESVGGNHVVIGIGLNLDISSAMQPQWIDIQEIMRDTPKRNQLAGMLIDELLTQIPIFSASQLTTFIDDWNSHDLLVGKTIQLSNAGKIITGKACGINEQGELLFQKEGCNVQVPYSYGEVSVQLEPNF